MRNDREKGRCCSSGEGGGRLGSVRSIVGEAVAKKDRRKQKEKGRQFLFLLDNCLCEDGGVKREGGITSSRQ